MMRARFVVALAWSLVSISSCAGPRAGETRALDGLAQVYKLDVENQARQTFDEYARYVRMFFEGHGLAPGWNEVARRLAAKAREEERADMTARLARLGAAVAVEWARDNSIRRVDTATLRGWAAALIRAADEGRLGEALADVERSAANRLGSAEDAPKEVTLFGSNFR